ncbi:hypothetical protein Ddye_005939 [Dipteronia dyeriana]|uniref:Uncharacterized protein n=1 Tax=Dipteronia dyeriana TaxID=168575 RepID=A0AAD9XHP0_9ROSI|nr:hypothetical protein Ddye_005939 [Dipteronia dyeriana]
MKVMDQEINARENALEILRAKGRESEVKLVVPKIGTKAKYKEVQQPPKKNMQAIWGALGDKEICQLVLRKRSSSVKGLGLGPKPTPIHSEEIIEETHRLQSIVATQAVEIEE